MFGPTTKAVMHLTGAAVAALCALFALAVWRLSAGPVSLGFLAPYVEQALVAEQSRLRLSFDELVLTWAGWERTLDIRARGVRAIASDGAALAGVPEMAIGLSLPAMARGLLAPTRLDVFGADVRLVRTAEGEIDLGVGDKVGDGRPGIAEELLRTFLASPDPDSPAGYLSELNIAQSRLTIRDRMLGVDWTAPSARIAIERRDDGLVAGAILAVALDDRLVDVTLSADYDTNSRLADVAVSFSALAPATLAGLGAPLAPLARFDLPVSGRLDLVADSAGRLQEVAFDLAGGAGTVALPEVLGGAESTRVALVQARGRLTDVLTRLVVDELSVDFGGPTVSASGQVAGDWQAPDMVVDLDLAGVPVAEIGRFWPPDVAAGARGWVGERITDGMLRRLALRLDIAGEDWPRRRIGRGLVDARFELADATIDYSPGLPPVRHVDGSGRFDGGALHAEVTAGVSGPLAVRAGTVELAGYDTGPGRAEVSVSFAGSLPDTLAALEKTPLATSRIPGPDPAAVLGAVEGELTVALPLIRELSDDAVQVSVGADLIGVEIAAGGLGELSPQGALSEGEAALLVDARGFDLTGEAQLDGTALGFHWHESFAAEPEIARRIDVTARLDDADRARLGVADARVQGPLDVELRINELGDGRRVGELDLGGARARLTVPILDWHKPPGAPASARFALEWDSAGISRVPRFRVRADGLSAEGSARRGEAGLWNIAFDRLVAGATNVGGEVRLRPDSPLEVGLYGRSLDLRPYFSTRAARDDVAGEVPPFDLVAEVGTVLVDEELVLNDVHARARFDGVRLTAAALTCALGRAENLVLQLNGGGEGRRRFTIDAEDAGAVFAALDITPNMTGGTLSVEGAIDDTRAEAPITGVVRVTDYQMVEAPMLAKLLNAVSITGALEMLGGRGIPFSRLEAPFAYAGDVLSLEGAVAHGLSIGLTFDGEVDLARDTIDLSGTIVPAYLLNTALGRIPVIGDLLTGGEGKGVFAATFVAEGPREAPTVSVNPLAVLTPGALRELLGRLPADGTPIQGAPGGRQINSSNGSR